MNRFIIDYDVVSIAQSLCDQHIVKMPLEECQMLCTALWHHAPEYAEENDLYKPVHQKHPCTLWAMHSRSNYEYAYSLYCAMLKNTTTDITNGMEQENTVLLYLKVVSSYQN